MAEKMFEEEEHPGIRNLWNGEMWFPFYIATQVIDLQLDVSLGVAERTLRELCAKGDIRSIRYDEDQEDLVVAADRDDLAGEEPELIRPSEWLGTELDLTAKYPHVIAVSQDDVLYWIDKQPNKRQQPRRNVTLAEFVALMKGRQQKPEPQIIKSECRENGPWWTRQSTPCGKAASLIAFQTQYSCTVWVTG